MYESLFGIADTSYDIYSKAFQVLLCANDAFLDVTTIFAEGLLPAPLIPTTFSK